MYHTVLYQTEIPKIEIQLIAILKFLNPIEYTYICL